MSKLGRANLTRLAVLLTGSLLATLPSAIVARERTAPKPRMNVLLIIADDLNMRMNATGFPTVKTPNLDRLAARSVNFANAYSQFPVCAQSRASFLTGRRPDTVKVYDFTTRFRDVLPSVVTLPQHFRNNGYYSARVGKVFHHHGPGASDELDDPASWHEVISPTGRDLNAERDGRLINLTPNIRLGAAFSYLADEGPDEDHTDGRVATETIRLLEGNRGKPFFIAAGFYRPHVPLIAPKKYFDLYPIDSVDFRPEAEAHLKNVLPAARGIHKNLKLTVEQQRRFIQAYYASTSFMDAEVGRVLDAVTRLGLEKDTIIVFASDHGFLLGEHGEWMKRMLYEPSLQVPLVISVPGTKSGRVSGKMVELVDIYPTLADLAGLPKPVGAEGRSLTPLLRNPDLRSWNYPAHSQVLGGRSVRIDGWRYTEWENGKAGIELYNHKVDPAERHNLASDSRYRSVRARLKAMMPKKPVGAREW
jgi:iduronate 2-sulfatase